MMWQGNSYSLCISCSRPSQRLHTGPAASCVGYVLAPLPDPDFRALALERPDIGMPACIIMRHDPQSALNWRMQACDRSKLSIQVAGRWPSRRTTASGRAFSAWQSDENLNQTTDCHRRKTAAS